MEKKYLTDELKRYGVSDMYPLHMPGHKRNTALWEAASEDSFPLRMDITEIEGFDNLHHAQGILKSAQEDLAGLCGADRIYYLVNGATAGILAAICAAAPRRGRILCARNCHKSVYHAMYLFELEADYLWPKETEHGIAGSVDPASVKEALCKQAESKSSYAAAVITSPTYDGVVSDIASIAKLVHAEGIPLIVDAAHGAHFGFSKGFPEKAIALGADYVIESVHKTLPSMTQTAVIHTADRPFVNQERLEFYLQLFQTSSPSYVLMAVIESCVKLLNEQGQELFAGFERRLAQFYEQAKQWKRVRILPSGANLQGIFWRDPSKILIDASACGYDGAALATLLRERYHLETEMSAGRHVTALMSIADTQEGFVRLQNALQEMDRRGEKLPVKTLIPDTDSKGWPRPPVEMTIAKALDAAHVCCSIEEAEGKICGGFVYPYPPGIPVLVPGERITQKIQMRLKESLASDQTWVGIRDRRIAVI